MKKIDKIGLVLMFLLFCSWGSAQNQTPSPEAQAANALWQAQKWDESVKAYETITKNEPNNGMAWLRLGSSLMSLNKLNEAVAPLEKAGEILRGSGAYYALGQLYAQLKDKEKAFEYLNKAAGVGFGQFNRLKNDPVLAGIRDDGRFNPLFESVERNARPCKYLPEAKQLDFWVGEWDVQANGQTVGKNVIQRLEEGCLIMENWTGNGGNTGKSMNFYDPVTKKWRQTYMGNGQVVWEMSGEYKDGTMLYEGEVHSTSGIVKTRVTFYNLSPDKIRHTEDHSRDGGKTWNNVWDTIYIRIKQN
jgi:tetratricopeptide (TPR) repeat protein